jgi:hypothetical protein
MPYRHAYLYVLALLPLAGLAFWQSYLSQVAQAPLQFHAHGVTATLWVLLLAAQGWSIHAGRRGLHRTLGLASLALFPLFLVGGVGIFLGMAQRFADALSPFYTLYAAKLAWLDIVAVAGFAGFYFEALRQRRTIPLHAGYLLATTIFLLPPILGRLSGAVMFATAGGPPDFTRLGDAFQFGNVLTVVIALVVAWRARPHGRPFLIAAGLTVAMTLLFQFVGGAAWWEALYAQAARLPTAPMAVAVAVAGALIGWAGWTAGRRPVLGSAAVAA